jgi:hypothetical protein
VGGDRAVDIDVKLRLGRRGGGPPGGAIAIRFASVSQKPLLLDHCVIAVSGLGTVGAQIDQKDEYFGHYRFGDWN